MSTKAKARSAAIETAEVKGPKTAETAAPGEAPGIPAVAGTAAETPGPQALAGAAAVPGIEDFPAAAQRAYDRWLKSSDTLVKGLEQINKSVLAYAQSSFDANLDTVRQLMACSTVTEAVEVQTSHVKAALDGLLAESSEVSRIAATSLADAFAPLQSEFSDRFAKLWKPLTA